jgi:hypothetical protein
MHRGGRTVADDCCPAEPGQSGLEAQQMAAAPIELSRPDEVGAALEGGPCASALHPADLAVVPAGRERSAAQQEAGLSARRLVCGLHVATVTESRATRERPDASVDDRRTVD